MPLAQKSLKLTHFLVFFVIGIGLFITTVGLLRGLSFREVGGVTIGLLVSIVPEGLPVAVTIILARGVWRMAKSRAIVRQMAAVEAMGNVDILMVDKTGTLTTGNMQIGKIAIDGQLLKVTGKGYQPEGEIIGKKYDTKLLTKSLELAYLSIKADVVKDEKDGWKPTGDPTEAAIAVLCRKLSLSLEKLKKIYKTQITNPFDSEKRFLEAKFTRSNQTWHVFIGAPDYLNRHLNLDHQKFQA